MSTFKCIESLEENPVEVFLEVTSILLRLVDNVLLYPSNPKYRKLKLENKLVSTVIMPSIGAMECLFEIGFQEDDDALLLPAENTSMEKLSQFRAEISSRRDKYLKKNSTPSQDKETKSQPSVKVERQTTPQPEASAATKPSVASAVTKPSVASAATIPSVARSTANSTNKFLEKLNKESTIVLQYEVESTKRKALSLVPLSEINERVQGRMRRQQHLARKNQQPLNEASMQETIFFTELMTWFKNDFFEWVNKPNCTSCHCETQFFEQRSNPAELPLADRVEVFQCGKCSTRVLFPRYNSVTKLLDTRKGRCGEWANAFTAVCRALNWDARFVMDETDHAWTEVYFKSEGRWVHCDPCECVLDKPLLYEKGWGKQLSYVIAYSCEEVQDVTWRYSANHSAVLARRKQCPEEKLVQTIQQLNQLRQTNLSEIRRKALARRSLMELVELMVPAVSREGDTEGRQSGSLAWRLARSETAMTQAQVCSYVFTPTPKEVEDKRMVISYCTGMDEYSRGLRGDTVKGWAKGVFEAENVFRKEEKDWKTVYLCRLEGTATGRVSWKVDLTKTGLRVDTVDIRCETTTYKTGSVVWLLCSGDKCARINNGHLTTSELRGSSELTLTASLSGGEGDVSWQHAQIFRQPLDSSEPAFNIDLTFIQP